MSTEYKFQSVVLQSEDIQEYFPDLISMMNSYLPKRKTPKRRKPRKKRITAGQLIDRIIADIEQN